MLHQAKENKRQLRLSPRFEDSVDEQKRVTIDCKANRQWKVGYSCWEAKGQALEAYKKLAPVIQDELDQTLEDSSSEVALSLFMVGKIPQEAKAVIIISSDDRETRIRAKYIIEKGEFLKNTRFELGLLRYPPSGPTRPVAMEDRNTSQLPSSYKILRDPSDHLRLVGMPIYIRQSVTSVRRATANMIYSGNDIGYITAAHALSPLEDSDESQDDDEDCFMPFDNDSDSGGGDKGEDSDASSGETRSARSSLFSSNSSSISQAITLRKDSSAEYTPFPEVKHEEFGEFEELGTVSSIMKSLDCVIIIITNPYTKFSLETQAKKLSEKAVVAAKARPAEVVALASREKIYGTLVDSPISMRLSKSKSFELVYRFSYDGHVRMGDCGTLVIDETTGELFGFIIATAADENMNIAYIMAAEPVVRELQLVGNWRLPSLSSLNGPILLEALIEAAEGEGNDESMVANSEQDEDSSDRDESMGGEEDVFMETQDETDEILLRKSNQTMQGHVLTRTFAPNSQEPLSQRPRSLSSIDSTRTDLLSERSTDSTSGQASRINNPNIITEWSDEHQRYYALAYDSGEWKFHKWVDRADGRVQGPREGRMVSGTYPAQNPQHFETLDPSYFVKPSSYFVEGRVFAVMFTELTGPNAVATDYNTSFSYVKFGQLVYAQVRRFIVVRQKREFCYAIPIFTYGERGTLKPGVVPDEHAVAYSYGYTPTPLQGEAKFSKDPICIVMNADERPLSIASRIYFGIHHPVQYNVKVKDLGYVHPDYVARVRRYWNAENDESSQSMDVTASGFADVGHEEDQEQRLRANPRGRSDSVSF